MRARWPLLVLLSSVVLLTIPAISARENESFGLTPHPEQVDGVDRGTFSIPLEPGATFEDAVRIYNRTDQTLDLAVYSADAEAAVDATDITVGFRTDDPEGVGSWIDLARETISLAPRDQVIVTFRVEVRSSEPKPELGAIVVENTARGVTGNAAQREFLAVRTVPPNTQTASVRVRPLLLRSPWIVVAMLGVVVVIALVWIGTRRARRPKDVLVPAGEIEQPLLEPPDPADEAPGSRPVIRRLGAPEPGVEHTSVLERAARPETEHDGFLVEVDEDDPSITGSHARGADDDGDGDEEDNLPPARHRPSSGSKPKPAARKAKPKPKAKAKPKARAKPKPKPKPKPKAPKSGEPKQGYIPLEEL